MLPGRTFGRLVLALALVPIILVVESTDSEPLLYNDTKDELHSSVIDDPSREQQSLNKLVNKKEEVIHQVFSGEVKRSTETPSSSGNLPVTPKSDEEPPGSTDPKPLYSGTKEEQHISSVIDVPSGEQQSLDKLVNKEEKVKVIHQVLSGKVEQSTETPSSNDNLPLTPKSDGEPLEQHSPKPLNSDIKEQQISSVINDSSNKQQSLDELVSKKEEIIHQVLSGKVEQSIETPSSNDNLPLTPKSNEEPLETTDPKPLNSGTKEEQHISSVIDDPSSDQQSLDELVTKKEETTHQILSAKVEQSTETPSSTNNLPVTPNSDEEPLGSTDPDPLYSGTKEEQHISSVIDDPSSEHQLLDGLATKKEEIIHQVLSGKVEQSIATPSSNDNLHMTPKSDEEPLEQHSHEPLPHTHDDHDHHHHHHHHHHRHSHDFFKDSNDTSSVILVIKHLSSTLLSFLPEPLQDTILDVDDALVFTGIIALTLVSICVPYFLIEGYMSVRPLKKKVVELNKSLWKVSAAYETQQEEFEIFKQKAIAHDEFKKRAEQSENDVVILKKLETKHREQITALKTQLKSQIKEAVDIRSMIEKTLEDKKLVSDECGKYKAAYENAKEALVKTREELANFQTHAKSSALQLGVSNKNAEMLASKIAMLEQEMEEMKSQLVTECEKRKVIEKERQEVEQSKVTVEKELAEIRSICHQYESTVSGLNEEISKLESELATIKETLGEDSPLLEVAEIQAKAAFAAKETDSLRTRLEGLSADNDNLNAKLKETATALEDARSEREQTNNRLQVLETYFKEREEEYIKTIEKLQLKESVRDKGKEELIRIIEEKDTVCKDLNERLEALKDEFDETKQQHRNEIRSLEAKGHDNWLSLCQAERKAQDARKEAELLRQRLTALSKEKEDEDGDGLNGEVPMYPVIPHELVPLPILDEPPSYFGLGDFVPPPPLPEGEEREPHRPPPLGGRLSPSFSDLDDHILSPIGGVGRREDDCTDGSSGSDSPRRSPPLRGGWVNVQHDRGGQGRESMRRLSRATSSPVQPGANL